MSGVAALVLLNVSRLYFFLIFQGSHDYVEISHLTLNFALDQLFPFAIVSSCSEITHVRLSCSPYLAVNL